MTIRGERVGEMGVTAEVLVVAAEDPAVSHTQLRVLVGLSTRMEASRWVPVAAAGLARRLHLTRETTARSLGQLVRAGWLATGPKVGTVKTYRPGPRCQEMPNTSNLTDTARRLAGVLRARLDATVERSISHGRLAEQLRISRGSVVAGMEQLVGAGVIIRGPRRGRVHTYRLPSTHHTQ